MTVREFQNLYHNYETTSQEEAEAEAVKVNEEGIEGDSAVAVYFHPFGWCLMLQSSLSAFTEMGIINDKNLKGVSG